MESCCACLHIEYKPVEHDGGLKSDRWVCFDCNREFQRVPPSDRIAALEAQLAAIRSVVNAQAEDVALWLPAVTAPEAYIQRELRRLHATVDGEK